MPFTILQFAMVECLLCRSGLLPLMVVLLPLATSILILAFRRILWVSEALSLASSVTLLPIVLRIYALFKSGESVALAHSITSSLRLVLVPEILGIIFSIMVSVLWVIANLYTISYMRKVEGLNKNRAVFYACFSASIGCTMGIAFSGNIVTMFIFYEMLTLCTYPLIIHSKNAAAISSGSFYIKALIGSSVLFYLPAVVIISNIVTPDMVFGQTSNLLADTHPRTAMLIAAMLCFGVAKAALMPSHVWLPKAMVAPTPVSALLHAVAVVKSGVFTVIKITVYVLGVSGMFECFASQGSGSGVASSYNILMYLSVSSMIIGSIIAVLQTNLKKLLAYSTIAQLAYIMLAASMYTDDSIKAAMLQMICHAFAKITLFFAVGSIYASTRKSEIKNIHGLGKVMPMTFLAFAIGAFSMIGIPPFSTFWGKFHIVSAALQQNNFLVIFAIVLSTLLNTLYFVPIVYKAFFGKIDAKIRVSSTPACMIIAMLLTCSCTITLFFIPKTILRILG